jgi:hypothetical protein
MVEIQGRGNAPHARLLGAVAIGEQALKDFTAGWTASKPWVAAALELALPAKEISRWARMAQTHKIWVEYMGIISVAHDSAIRSAPMGLGWAHVLITHPLAGGKADQDRPFIFFRRSSPSTSLLPGELRRFFGALDAAVAVPLRKEWAPALWSEAIGKGGMVQNCEQTGSLEGWLVRGDSKPWGNLVAKLLANGKIEAPP